MIEEHAVEALLVADGGGPVLACGVVGIATARILAVKSARVVVWGFEGVKFRLVGGILEGINRG